jgi:hypothetical protein
MKTQRPLAFICILAMLCVFGCQKKSDNSRSQTADANQSVAPQQQGVEKAKPAPGTGNVQGKVLYNGKPAEGIEVKLCETFSRFLSGCGGKIFAAQTDKDGDYVIANVEPKVYEGLMARVFNTDSYVFATSGIAGLSSTKYEVVADKTLFVSPTNLFKSDLKITNPKAGAKVSTNNLELKWDAYPDAAYYKFSIYPEDSSVTSPYVNERTDSPSFSLNKPLQKGTYRWQVEAYNGSDQKLSESADDIKFTITDGAGG